VDRRADLYAVGVMLYRMVTGRLPFAGKKPRQIYDKILRGQPTHPRDHRSDVSNELAAVVLKAMSVRKSERYDTAEAFYEDLKLAVPDMEATGPMPVITRSGIQPSGYPPSIDETAPTRDARPSRGPLSIAETQKREGNTSSRRQIALGLGALALVGAGAAVFFVMESDPVIGDTPADIDIDDEGALVPAGPAIVYGVSRYGDDEVIHATHDPLCAYLSARLGRPVELRIVADHELSELLDNGGLSFAALSPKRYVEQKHEHPQLRVVATASNPGGTSYVGQILVRADSDIRAITDLEGKEMCFPSRDSTSGYLYPAALLRQAGVENIHSFLRGVHWYNGSHAEALRALAAGECDAAAVAQNTVQEAGFAVQAFHPIATTPRIPYDAYVIAPGVEQALADNITDALLSLSPGSREATEVFPAGAQLLGFTEASDEDYDEAREIIGLVAAE
jgi:phosphate/phosphite/phosphonate ABC transporter binding protein